MIGRTNARPVSGPTTFTVNFDSSTFSSGANLSYADDAAELTPLDNSHTTGTVNSSMSWGSWQTLADNPWTKDCYYALIYGDGTEIELNQNDLTKGKDGTDYSTEITQQNVMFVIPTRYITRSSAGFTHSRSSSAGSPLAHTIDNTVYSKVAIGVYPSVVVSNVAKSISGSKPTPNLTRAQYRTDSKANGNPSNGVWIQWNIHQYQMIRDMVLASTLKWNSQLYIGKGNLSGSNANNWALNGLYNNKGIFVGSQSSGSGYAVKAFLENLWGMCYQYVDDVVTGNEYADSGAIWKDVWAGQNSNPQISVGETDTGAIITSDKVNIGKVYLGPNTGKISGAWKNPKAIGWETSAGWGLPTLFGGSTSTYTTDGIYVPTVNVSGGVPSTTTARNYVVGGASNGAQNAGITAMAVDNNVERVSWHGCSRLAFVFD